MNRAEIKTEFLVRYSKDTTSGFYTDTIIENWINQSNRFVAGFRKWPFTERRDATAAFSNDTETYAKPSDFRADSTRIMVVGTKLLTKIDFRHYQRFREDREGDAAEVFSEFGRQYYINPNLASGTIYAYGQYTPANIAIGDGGDSDELIFSGEDAEGEEALLQEMQNYALQKEKKYKESNNAHKKAIEILIGMWERIQEEQHTYHSKGEGMFTGFDVLTGAPLTNINKRLQWPL